MKSPLLMCLAGVGIGVIVFTAGYCVGGASERTATPLPLAAQQPSGAAPAQLGTRDSDPRIAAAADPLTSDETRIRTFQLLGEPNRIVRFRLLCEMLNHVSAQNWRGALDAFAVQTKAEGRWQPDEWHLLVERIGEVAGPEALADALRLGQPSDLYRARNLLAGFAAGNPQAALDWFHAQPPERQTQFFNNLLSGLARSDPQQAMALILDQPREIWEPNATSIIDGAIQSGGFQAAEALFAGIRSRSDVPEPFKSNVFYDLVKRQITVGAEPTKILGWMEPHLTLAGPNALKETLTLAANADAMQTLTWLEERTERITAAQLPAAYATVAGILRAKAPEKFSAWMKANPDHLQHDSMAQVASQAFLQTGQFDQARQWNETVRDPQQRARLEAEIRASEANAQRGPQGVTR